MEAKTVMRQIGLSCILVLLNVLQVKGQPSSNLKLTLSNVIDLAITQSSSVKYAQNRYENYYWRYKNFQARFRPQLTLSGDMPDYVHSTTPVVQSDGSVEFKQVSNVKTTANLSLGQMIPQTGTHIYASSSMYRNQNLIKDTVNFSGYPFRVGFTQPVFAFNWMKWSRKTEPLVYTEAQKDFIESIEEIAIAATARFFRYLRVQTNYNLAQSNLSNSQDNLKIAETKKQLGTISDNDFSRIKLSVFTAKKALNQASMDLKNADFELKSYVGIDQDMNIELNMPLNIRLFEVNPEKALQEALANRKETTQYKRRLIEADRDLTQAKRNNGLSATLRGSYGLSNDAAYFNEVYDDPRKLRQLKLSLAIPILDWGRSSSNVKLAESRRSLIVFNVEKDRDDFERQVVVQVEQFSLLKVQLETASEADKVAENGYLIALKKFQNGEISITDLNISLSEREKAKRDYIRSLETYWLAYYRLRELTLFDFEANQQIQYDNPLLDGLINKQVKN